MANNRGDAMSLGEAASSERIRQLEIELARTQIVLGTLIEWIAQSAGSPLSADNAAMLLKELARRTKRETP
jgi:hypothetical protein